MTNQFEEMSRGANVADVPQRATGWRAIAVAGTVAGVLDLAYIVVFYAIRFPEVGAIRLLQGIAAGLIGRDAARSGGAATAALGGAIHFAIALTVAAVFYALSRRFKLLTQRPIICGAGYGVAVWLVMNLVVLPLTATPPKSFPPPLWLPVLIAHVVCVGIPIAIVVRRTAR